MSGCERLVETASAGVAPALRAVDCMAGETTAVAFNRLFGAEGAMVPVLTILLTLYIAFFAISLLTGRSSLGISALTPRMLTLGLVLTFATSWAAYSQVVWNLSVGAPDWIASVLTGAQGSATQIFADRIDIIMAAIGQAGGIGNELPTAQTAQAAQGAAQGAASGNFTPANLMWLGALLLLLGSVGVLITVRIALAVLVALGPVFVVLALFDATRGLAAGWLRGVVLTGITPLFVVVGGTFTLELMVPVIAGLNGLEGISPRAALALFLLASVHVALMVMVLKVAATMVSGWQVFGLGRKSAAGAREVVQPAVASSSPLAAPLRPAGAQGARRAAVAAAAPLPQGAPLEAGGAVRASERRSVVTQVSGGGIEPVPVSAGNRARGIGSRFRPASNDTGRKPSREMNR